MTFSTPSDRFIAIQDSLNFRDFGGYPTITGDQLVKGKLFRCGMLTDLKGEALQQFSGLDIGVICDLRREDEVELYPSPNHPAFECIQNIPIAPGTSSELRTSMMEGADTPEDQVAFMTEITKEIARDHLDAYRRVLRCLIETEQGFLIHCMAGKDRTGFGVAVIQLMLGVSRNLVMEDYLLTNQATELITRTRARMAEQNQAISEATLDIIARVKRVYLEAALLEVDAEYAGIPGYLEAMGLTTQEHKELLTRWVIPA